MALDTSKALVEPSPAMRIDEVALARYLQSHVKDFVADSVLTFQFSHGQSNPTYLVKAGRSSYVLRKKPPGKVLPSAHAVDREYRVLAALQGTAVPVPRTVLLCEDSSVLGTPFYLMEHVKGRIYADPSLPGVEPAGRARIYEGMARTLAALHSVDPAAVGLAGYGKASGYNRRQVWRWGQQYLKSVQGEPMTEMVRLMQWLENHIPAGDDNPSVTRISHGDFRLDNLVLAEGDPGRVLAVLDWELSTLGDPLADLAYNCLPYVMPSDVPSLPSLPRPLPPGIPQEQDYIRMYCEARGIAYPLQADWPFYLALSLFRLCSILAGVGARAAQGNASSRIAGQVGADSVVRSLALTGLRIVGEAPAPARAAAHAVLTGTPQEPYVNPRHPAARPDPNRMYEGNPLEEYANPSTAWQSAAGKAEQALREVDNLLPATASGTATSNQKIQRGAGGASLARNPTAAAGKPARISGATADGGVIGASGEFVGEGLAGVGRGEPLPTGAGGAAGASNAIQGPRISEETAEDGIIGASGEFVREGLRGVGSGEPLPTGHAQAISPGLGPSPRVQPILLKLKAFMEEHIYPAEAVLGAHAHSDKRWTIHPLQEELKEKAKRQGLWNLWLPADMARGLAPLMDLLGVQGAERAALLGPGLTNLEYAHCAEVMGRSLWAPECFNCSAPDTGNMEVLARYGSRSQQQRWLVPLLRGNIRSAFAMTEPAVASSDATNIQASIAKTPDGGYVLNGRKWWTSGACDPRCKIAIFMGKSDPSGPTHSQQSMVLVPMDAPGVTVVRPLPVFGYDDAPHGHAECNFEDVRVPGDSMILGEGRGFEIAQGRLGPGRLHHCMRTLGAAERALELMVKRAGDRTAFGASLYRHQSVRLDIANSRVELDAARLVVLEAARALDEVGNKAARGKIAAAKALAPTAALRIIDRAIQVHGGAGVTDVTPLAHMWAGIRTLRLADGPDVVHLETIAKLELSAVARRARL